MTLSIRCIDISELGSAVGDTVGPTDWVRVRQGDIDAFADATNDHQWIHVDTVRAALGPFGGTVAHGLYTLALLPGFLEQLLEVRGASLAVNYGFDRVRFPSPVRVESQVRASLVIGEASPSAGRTLVSLRMRVELEDETKPACIADFVVLYIE